MKRVLEFVWTAVAGGLLILVPVYLAILLLLKGMKSLVGLVRPIAILLPDTIPAEGLLSLLLVLLICFLIGIAVRTPAGRVLREQLEKNFFERIPGYALVEIEDALVPGFIIEELADGRYTVFVPSIPTPLAGAVYILDRERVHPLDVPFTQAFMVISKWGSGGKDLVAAMESKG